MPDIDLKEDLLRHCRGMLESQILDLKKTLDSILYAKNQETKSSAGDKYETGRSMMQMEADKIMSRLDKAKQAKVILEQIRNHKTEEMIQAGSLILTNEGNYLIATAMGKVEMNNHMYYLISQQSPLGSALMGRTKQDTFLFNGRRIQILDVI